VAGGPLSCAKDLLVSSRRAVLAESLWPRAVAQHTAITTSPNHAVQGLVAAFLVDDVERAREVFFRASELQLRTQQADGCYGPWWECDTCLGLHAATKGASQALQRARLNKLRWWLATRTTDVHLSQ